MVAVELEPWIIIIGLEMVALFPYIGIVIGKTKQTAYKILQAAQWDEISFAIHTLNEIATKCLENLEKRL